MKKIITIVSTILVLFVLGFGTYTLFFKEDKNSTLTIIEKQWIEDNKNNIIDLGIVNNIPIFNYNGEGVIFDFIEDIESNTGLEFNKISYSYEKETTSEYSFILTDEVNKNDIVVYTDNYVLISNNNKRYDNISEIEPMVIGIIESDLEKINYYLTENSNLSFKTYDSKDKLIKAIQDKNIDGAVVPKLVYLDDVIENELYINYNLTSLEENLVLRLGETSKLNTIIKKYFEKWYNENYSKSYSNNFSNYYFEINNISDDSKVNFKSKQYKFGFVSNAPYNQLVNGKLIGLNNEIIKNFATIADIELKYYEYNNSKELLENFNNNKLDLYFNTFDNETFDMDVFETLSVFKEDIVVLSKSQYRQEIDTLSALKNKKVMTVQNSKISKELDNKEIKYKGYETVDDLLNNLKTDYLVILDRETYNTYKNNSLKDYIDVYYFNLNDEYNYIIRDINDNKVFMNYFNFYLSFINYNEITKNINYDAFIINSDMLLLEYITIAIVIAAIILIILILTRKKKNGSKKNQVSKEDRIKYIDMLTSLKNRNYLNDSIEKWDESEIYPQAIIIVDLNNVAYINDNYGHAEGDNVIKEAANILFKNQIENSEIMRTNGNEFLIYLVEYDEKQVVSYIRKLNREFKELSHGFGAALGYSMITDGLKTIDDAINEATLDMRTNKEEAR